MSVKIFAMQIHLGFERLGPRFHVVLHTVVLFVAFFDLKVILTCVVKNDLVYLYIMTLSLGLEFTEVGFSLILRRSESECLRVSVSNYLRIRVGRMLTSI